MRKRSKYSVSEIDRMRETLQARRRYVSVVSPIEDELRTHMLNGSSPEELEESAKAAEDESILTHLRKIKARSGGSTVFAHNSRGEQLTA